MLMPEDMRSLPQWVIAKNGSKAPLQTNGLPASVSKPYTWSTYDDAVNAVKNGVGEFVGFVFTDDSGIIGIDIDDGFRPSGILNDLSVDCMTACESFTERSRSGRGIHIYVKGTLPFNGMNNRAGVEIYKAGRYFICTGDSVVYDKLTDGQDGIDYIVNTYFSMNKPVENYGYKAPIYTPRYQAPKGRTIYLSKTEYPPIDEGCRNISLTSLAGQLRSDGYSREEILSRLQECNAQACLPPLPQSEIVSIVNSILRYR